jgi:hypothetical protein
MPHSHAASRPEAQGRPNSRFARIVPTCGLLLVCGVIAGCGNGAESGDQGESGDADNSAEAGSDVIESNPLAVSKAFIRAVVASDAEACRFMNSNAIMQFEVRSGEADCDMAVKAWQEVLSTDSDVLHPKDVLTGLEEAELNARGEDAHVKLELPKKDEPTPTKTELTLRLVNSEAGWQVDYVLVSQRVVCRLGEKVGEGSGC